MQASDNLNSLAERVQEGDARARTELRERLERQMARITRRALSANAGSSGLSSKILSTAHRLDERGKPRSHLVHQVASNLCQTVVNRLWTGSTEGRFHTQTA